MVAELKLPESLGADRRGDIYGDDIDMGSDIRRAYGITLRDGKIPSRPETGLPVAPSDTVYMGARSLTLVALGTVTLMLLPVMVAVDWPGNTHVRMSLAALALFTRMRMDAERLDLVRDVTAAAGLRILPLNSPVPTVEPVNTMTLLVP